MILTEKIGGKMLLCPEVKEATERKIAAYWLVVERYPLKIRTDYSARILRGTRLLTDISNRITANQIEGKVFLPEMDRIALYVDEIVEIRETFTVLHVGRAVARIIPGGGL